MIIVEEERKEVKQKIVGKTTATELSPNTVDSFSFWIAPGEIINPFDFVSVSHVRDTTTVGIVKEMIAMTDAPSHLSNFVSSEFGKVEIEPNTLRIGATVAKAAVMANTGMKIGDRTEPVQINMPIESDRPVRWATAPEVGLGLGIEKIRMPIPAGLIEMSNGSSVPVLVDADYLLGPEAAHINVSGISGLATKTSYMAFLLQSIVQKIGKENIALIVFNVKQQDLLHLHEKPDDLDQRDIRLYEKLELKPQPFENVTYFLPRGERGRANSDHVPGKHKIYAYELGDVYNRLDLLFSEVSDPEYTMASILEYVRESWPLRYRNDVQREGKTLRRKGQPVATWQDLVLYENFPHEVVSSPRSLGKFHRHLRRLATPNLFPESRGASVYLGEEITQIRAGDVHVIDINRIGSTEEQAFIIGDMMRSIDEMYSERESGIPTRIIILIDELNRYSPRRTVPAAVGQQIMEIARTGRSRGTILFGAEQFKSAVHDQVHENSGTHAIGRTGASELGSAPYSFLDRETKMNITRLGKGELVLSHATFRQPVKIVFPKPAYRRPPIGEEPSKEAGKGTKKPLYLGAKR